jgi:hypothetical protein
MIIAEIFPLSLSWRTSGGVTGDFSNNSECPFFFFGVYLLFFFFYLCLHFIQDSRLARVFTVNISC